MARTQVLPHAAVVGETVHAAAGPAEAQEVVDLAKNHKEKVNKRDLTWI